ncbi:OCT7 [Symbiodinium natans]|uniref:OCT7 protein n=1 Tax=Symbiodinium natans TaxID=878477 RepID=A0A812U110_9DINO|nr:OCT7 [Symbiodinium natans]
MILGKISERAESPETPECDEIRDLVTVTEALDGMELGRFHACHLLRMIFFWAVLAMTQECTPYLFPGLRKFLQADDRFITSFAAAFPLGCVVGSAAASLLLDRLGRRGTVIAVSPFAVLIVLRTLQSVVFATTITALSTWYIEFLPTTNRGMLMAAYSLGWPVGRAVVIFTASLARTNWTSFMAVTSAGFALLFLIMSVAEESPRFLVASGKLCEANEVLTKLYAVNRQSPWQPSQLCLHKTHVGNSSGRCATGTAWSQLLERENRQLMIFSLALFGVLASTTVLLDTWGPGLYHSLLAPESQELPTGILMLFNIGDLTGVAISIMIVDRIGRAGSFVVGFFVQGTLLALITLVSAHHPILYSLQVFCGTLSAACRCFGWESAQMWTLEAFPTEIRAIAFSTSTAAMRFFSILSLRMSSQYVHSLSAATSLRFLAGMLIAGGFLSTGLLPKETAQEPMSEGGDVKHY